MDQDTVDALLAFIDSASTVKTLDLTGGAPELNPLFKSIVSAARKRGIQVIDRCNLTVLFEPGQENTATFLAENKVKIVASLPCYIKDNVDKQRGDGTFETSWAGPLVVTAALLVRATDGYMGIMLFRYVASKYSGDEEAVTVSFGIFGMVVNVFGAVVSSALVESGIIKD